MVFCWNSSYYSSILYLNIPKRFIAESKLTFCHPHEHICHIIQYDNSKNRWHSCTSVNATSTAHPLTECVAKWYAIC